MSMNSFEITCHLLLKEHLRNCLSKYCRIANLKVILSPFSSLFPILSFIHPAFCMTKVQCEEQWLCLLRESDETYSLIQIFICSLSHLIIPLTAKMTRDLWCITIICPNLPKLWANWTNSQRSGLVWGPWEKTSVLLEALDQKPNPI